MAEKRIISTTPHEAAVLLTLDYQRLDYRTNSRLRLEIADAVAFEPHLPVVLDVSKLDVLSSLVIGTMVDLRQCFSKSGRLPAAGARSDPIGR